MSIRGVLKRNKHLHFIFTLYTDRKVRSGYVNYLIGGSNRKARSLVRRELTLLDRYWGYPPYHYYRYKLFRKNLKDDELLDFIPPYFYFNVYWQKRNGELDQRLYQSKIYQHNLFKKYSIPSVDILAYKKGNLFYDNDGNKVSLTDMLDVNLSTPEDALFCKPDHGRGGKGIIHISSLEGTLMVNHMPSSYDKLISMFSADEDYIIQRKFIQSKYMSRINASSVNTLRIYTQFNNGQPAVPACVLRMGVKNSYVDNLSQGGLMNVIDTESGFLSDYAKIRLEDKKYYEHPDTGFVFKGAQILNWHEIKTQILKYTEILSECKDLGWDVALGEDGIKVLEINIQHGIDHPQMVFGGMRRILGVFPENTGV